MLGLAAAANADTIAMVSTTYPGGLANGWQQGFGFTAYVNRVINENNSGFDQFDVVISYIGGMTQNGNATGSKISAMEGTWTIQTPGSGFEMVSTAAGENNDIDNGPDMNWPTYTNNTGSRSQGLKAERGAGVGRELRRLRVGLHVAGKQSYIHRHGTGDQLRVLVPDGPGQRVVPSFSGSWYKASGAAAGLYGNGTSLIPPSLGGPAYGTETGFSRLARLYVPTGVWNPATEVLLFQGVLGFSYNNGQTEDAMLETVLTPEPATLVMLAGGAAGLLGYAWRAGIVRHPARRCPPLHRRHDPKRQRNRFEDLWNGGRLDDPDAGQRLRDGLDRRRQEHRHRQRPGHELADRHEQLPSGSLTLVQQRHRPMMRLSPTRRFALRSQHRLATATDSPSGSRALPRPHCCFSPCRKFKPQLTTGPFPPGQSGDWSVPANWGGTQPTSSG